MSKLIIVCVLSILILNIDGRPQETSEPTTWDKIKKGVEHGFKVAYDETHCGFHKIKELVKHHEHDDGSDPCENKPYQQIAPASTTPVITLRESI